MKGQLENQKAYFKRSSTNPKQTRSLYSELRTREEREFYMHEKLFLPSADELYDMIIKANKRSQSPDYVTETVWNFKEILINGRLVMQDPENSRRLSEVKEIDFALANGEILEGLDMLLSTIHRFNNYERKKDFTRKLPKYLSKAAREIPKIL